MNNLIANITIAIANITIAIAIAININININTIGIMASIQGSRRERVNKTKLIR